MAILSLCHRHEETCLTQKNMVCKNCVRESSSFEIILFSKNVKQMQQFCTKSSNNTENVVFVNYASTVIFGYIEISTFIAVI